MFIDIPILIKSKRRALYFGLILFLLGLVVGTSLDWIKVDNKNISVTAETITSKDSPSSFFTNIEKEIHSSSTRISDEFDQTLEKRLEGFRQEIIKTRGSGCATVYSDSVEYLVCTDEEAERQVYLQRCMSKGYSVIDSLYASNEKMYDEVLSVQEQEIRKKWKLIQNCIPNKEKYWHGLYNSETKEVFWFAEVAPLEGKELFTRLAGAYQYSSDIHPVFIIETSARSIVYTIVNPNKLIIGHINPFVFSLEMYYLDDFKKVGKSIILDKGVVTATNEGIILFDQIKNKFDLIIPIKDYGLFKYSDYYSDYIDSLEKIGPNSFQYQIYDDEGLPVGNPVLYTLP